MRTKKNNNPQYIYVGIAAKAKILLALTGKMKSMLKKLSDKNSNRIHNDEDTVRDFQSSNGAKSRIE